MIPKTRQRLPLVNSALRPIALVTPGLSTTATGIATHNIVNTMNPGTISRTSPNRNARAESMATPSTGNTRASPRERQSPMLTP